MTTTDMTLTLPESTWDTIRVAVLCLACDCRTAGKHEDADYWSEAYRALKEEMGY